MMHTIFISGSMRIKNIDEAVINRINNIISSDYRIILGDADGVDTSIQEYLNSRGVGAVKIYCAGARPRNNIGNWIVNKIETDNKPGTREYFTAKDISMARDCDYGLMIWDSKSTGTLSNVLELLSLNKNSLIYVNKLKKFHEVSSVKAFEDLLSVMSESALVKAENKINITNKINKIKLNKIKNRQLKLF